MTESVMGSINNFFRCLQYSFDLILHRSLIYPTTITRRKYIIISFPCKENERISFDTKRHIVTKIYESWYSNKLKWCTHLSLQIYISSPFYFSVSTIHEHLYVCYASFTIGWDFVSVGKTFTIESFNEECVFVLHWQH